MNPAHKSASTRRIILVTVLVTFILTTLVWLGIGGLGYYALVMRTEPDFHVAVDHPDTVVVGEEFDVIISVESTNGKSLNLHTIDLDNDLLEGFEIVSMDPKPGSKIQVIDMTSYTLRPQVRATTKHDFTLRLRATKTGSWGGDIDCCTALGNFLTTHTSIDVGFPPEPVDGAGKADPAVE